MRIRMKTVAAGPIGVFDVGKIYEVDAAFGGTLVEIGVAEDVSPAPPAATPVVEEAAIEPTERAVPKRGRERGTR